MSARTITRDDDEWPQGLNRLQVFEPPGRLFVEGKRLETSPAAVAIVGSRRPTAAGLEIAREIARGIAEAGFAVVSGFAVGIDTAAHQAALEVAGYTIAVLGCGLDVEYPRRNHRLKQQVRARGTLVTEYDPGVVPHPGNFPARNRIIAGLSDAVVFVEGTDRSGGLITARIAVEENRHVFAVPGSVRNPMAKGPNELIRAGHAGVAACVEHVLETVAPGLVWGGAGEDARAFGQPSVNATEGAVLLFLDDAPTPVDRMVSALDRSFGEVAMALAALEVRNYVVKRRGGYVLTEGGARIRQRLPAEDCDIGEIDIPTASG